MSVEALNCASCGATLEPRILESKVKCNYCATVYVIVRDHDGVRGLSREGSQQVSQQNASQQQQVSEGTQPHFGTPPIDPQVVARLERDALLAVRGLEAAAQTAVAARGLARVGSCGCLSVVLLALTLAGLVVSFSKVIGFN